MSRQTSRYPEGVRITGADALEFAEILSPDALTFVAGLELAFRDTRASLLRRRAERQAR